MKIFRRHPMLGKQPVRVWQGSRLLLPPAPHPKEPPRQDPGPVPRAASGIDRFDELLDRVRERTPANQLVTVGEIGRGAAFLTARPARRSQARSATRIEASTSSLELAHGCSKGSTRGRWAFSPSCRLMAPS